MSASRRILVPALLAAFALQLGVPLWMIASRERVLRTGEVFRFKTAPVDPYDAFRGRYVALRMEENSVPAPDGASYRRGARVCVTLRVDEEGFAHYDALVPRPPADVPWVRARVQGADRGSVRIAPPSDRFYMEESEAPRAERAYREHSTRARRDAYIQVRVLDGRALVEDLYVGGRPIREVLRETE